MGMATLSLDVTNIDSISEARMEVQKLTKGNLDILVNNAGRNCTLPALDVNIDDARACFETNFFSIILTTQAFTPFLIASHGLILNIGSIAAIMPYVFGSVYNASKAALHSFSNTLRLELEPYDVRVLVVVTGGVQSNIARTKRVLPEGSLYVDIEEHFTRRVNHSQVGAMPADVYARGVVKEALKSPWRQKKWLWRGNKSGLVWFLSNFLGGWVFDLVVPRMFGLDRLRRIVRARTLGLGMGK
ncbi:hypothetical protein EG329_003391 [Mollisiaceae sp. DMI_Dod_QoI]|nr:hypothetical protein EG329_003391 [Helotiales sp. DMI_Dod_QoI]